MYACRVCTVASLLSCLHQLRTENVRLEEHVGNLLQRRDHLLAVNARLAIPLTAGEFCWSGGAFFFDGWVLYDNARAVYADGGWCVLWSLLFTLVSFAPG